MLGFLLIVIAFVVLVTLLIQPKSGVWIALPLIFLYPHLYMYKLDLLPWNIGVDDLFICVFFVVVLIRRNVLGDTPIRLGFSVTAAAAYLLIWTIAHLSGWRIMPELETEDVLKPILKCAVFFMFTYALIHCLDDHRDLMRAAKVYVATMALTALTVILHDLFPAQMVIFTSAQVEQFQQWYGKAPRAVGSLQSPNTGCALLGMTVLFVLPVVRQSPQLTGKLWLLGCLPVLLIGMLLTESRTGALAMLLTLPVMVLASRARGYAWLILVGVVLAIAVQPALFSSLWERVEAVYNPTGGGQLDPNVSSRVDVWRDHVSIATPQSLLLGQGQVVPIARIGLHTHSTYISALFVHGIFGAVWLVLFTGILVKYGIRTIRTGLEPYRTLASSILWAMLAWGIAGLALDMLVSQTSRFTYWFLALMMERIYHLSRSSAGTTEETTITTVSPGGFLVGTMPRGAAW